MTCRLAASALYALSAASGTRIGVSALPSWLLWVRLGLNSVSHRRPAGILAPPAPRRARNLGGLRTRHPTRRTSCKLLGYRSYVQGICAIAPVDLPCSPQPIEHRERRGR